MHLQWCGGEKRVRTETLRGLESANQWQDDR